MNIPLLKKVANEIVANGRGILAADESTGTIEKKLNSVGINSTEKTRQAYRQLLFTTQGLEKYISGVILFDETIHQKSDKGTPFPKLLKEKGIHPGIKVDMKAHDMANFPGETITHGLDGLRERLAEYATLGATFTKWRAVITIGKGIPTATCIEANAQALAQYAALAQEAGLVPIVEPEILMDGNHSLDRCESVTEDVLKMVFRKLVSHRVYIPGILLKPNMVVAGVDAKSQPSVEKVAKTTVTVFKKVLPKELPGVVFLSGGQSPDQACENMNAINKINNTSWPFSFSFGRALQQEALQTWQGKKTNVKDAQQVFLERAQKCSLATQGKLN